MTNKDRGIGVALVVLTVVLCVLAVLLVNTNSALNRAERDNHGLSIKLREAQTDIQIAEENLADRQEMVEGCAAQSTLYRFAVEGLAAKVITLLESGTFPDIKAEVDAKQKADEYVCE